MRIVAFVRCCLKLQRDGLGSIILFGHQVQIEKRVEEIETDISSVASKIQKQEEACNKYVDTNNVASPSYWLTRIIRTLQRSGGWAETDGIQIKKHQIKARVTESEVRRLGQLVAERSEDDVKAEFERLISVYEKTNSASSPISPEISVIKIPYSILSTAKIQMARKPKSTPLSEREQALLDLMGISTLVNAKGFLSVTSNTVCPQCLQNVSAEHRSETLALLDRILNREVEDYQNNLRSLMIPLIPETQYDAYSCVDAVLVEKIRLHIRLVNTAIGEHNDALMAKIGDPMGNAAYEDSHKIGDALMALNALLSELEEKRLAFNKVIADRKKTEKQLVVLNDLIGHYSIIDDYARMVDQDKAQESDKELLFSLKTREKELRLEQKELDDQRKNYKLAVDQINQSLSYIYFSKTRFEVVLESDQLYHLKVNGMPVTPDKISCGERNALALCYFFTEIARETDFDKMYSSEFLLGKL